ncbi:MAG: hypothetical protein JNM17_02665 [Archangium sp.]|nr:hypothetical protein [Archangium sp.]
MRTTIVVRDVLLRAAKKRAAELDLPLSGFIERALRSELERATTSKRPFRLVVNKKAKLKRGLSWDSLASQLDDGPNGLP